MFATVTLLPYSIFPFTSPSSMIPNSWINKHGTALFPLSVSFSPPYISRLLLPINLVPVIFIFLRNSYHIILLFLFYFRLFSSRVPYYRFFRCLFSTSLIFFALLLVFHFWGLFFFHFPAFVVQIPIQSSSYYPVTFYLFLFTFLYSVIFFIFLSAVLVYPIQNLHLN